MRQKNAKFLSFGCKNMDILGENSPVLMRLISPELQKRLLDAAVVQRFDEGQIVHSRGDGDFGLSIVKSGKIKLGTYGLNGIFAPVAVFEPGASFGEHTVLVALPRILDCVAAEPTELYHIKKENFDRIFQDEPDLSRALLAIALVRLHGVLEFLDDHRRLSLPVQTAKLILSLAQTIDSQKIVRASQSEIAATLGVSRVSFGKVLAQLVKLGFVERGYGKILITDIKALEAWVEQQIEVMPLRVPEL